MILGAANFVNKCSAPINDVLPNGLMGYPFDVGGKHRLAHLRMPDNVEVNLTEKFLAIGKDSMLLFNHERKIRIRQAEEMFGLFPSDE